jgi:hypothetical protein
MTNIADECCKNVWLRAAFARFMIPDERRWVGSEENNMLVFVQPKCVKFIGALG